jgi:hypothetical protein
MLIFSTGFMHYCRLTFSLVHLPHLSPLPKVNVQYIQTLCGWEGGGCWVVLETIFCRSLTLCFWAVSEPTKLLRHPKQKPGGRGGLRHIQGGSDKSGIFSSYFQMTQHSWKSSDLIEVKANLQRYISRILLIIKTAVSINNSLDPGPQALAGLHHCVPLQGPHQRLHPLDLVFDFVVKLCIDL